MDLTYLARHPSPIENGVFRDRVNEGRMGMDVNGVKAFMAMEESLP